MSDAGPGLQQGRGVHGHPGGGRGDQLQQPQLVLSPEEVSSVFTVPLSTLVQPANHGYTQFRAGGRGWSLPVYHGGVPHVIWGLTAIMTAQLLRALLPSSVYRHHIHYQSPLK